MSVFDGATETLSLGKFTQTYFIEYHFYLIHDDCEDIILLVHLWFEVITLGRFGLFRSLWQWLNIIGSG